MRLIDSCITQLKAQGPSRTCSESKEEEKKKHPVKKPTQFVCTSNIQSVTKSIGKIFRQSVRQSVSKILSQTVSESVKYSDSQSVGQSVKHPVRESVSQSASP